MADRAVKIFELDPVLVFWSRPIWHVPDIAEDGERLGTGREILARPGTKIENCKDNSCKNEEGG
jgi:hypothetical protein